MGEVEQTTSGWHLSAEKGECREQQIDWNLGRFRGSGGLGGPPLIVQDRLAPVISGQFALLCPPWTHQAGTGTPRTRDTPLRKLPSLQDGKSHKEKTVSSVDISSHHGHE